MESLSIVVRNGLMIMNAMKSNFYARNYIITNFEVFSADKQLHVHFYETKKIDRSRHRYMNILIAAGNLVWNPFQVNEVK